MNFTKMNGTGNDFIIIDNRNGEIEKKRYSSIAKTLCDRRNSLGADGFMFVEEPQQGGDYKMVFYNRDGSLGEMCGNGARCIARYGHTNGLAGKTQRIETTAGIVEGEQITERVYRVKLNSPTKIQMDIPIEINGRVFSVSYVELGNPAIPHAVVEYEDFDREDERKLREYGAQIRSWSAFPKGVNVNFYYVNGDGHLMEKTFERGVEDFTLSCGTGTGSLGLILTLKGISDGNGIEVNVPGGKLSVDVEIRDDGKADIYLSGITNYVARGEILDEDLIG